MDKRQLLASLVLFAFPSMAVIPSHGYSKNQLIQMMALGIYPERKEFMVKVNKSQEFTVCRAKARDMLLNVTRDAPVEEEIDNRSYYVAKIWAADGLITIMCNQRTQETVILHALYR